MLPKMGFEWFVILGDFAVASTFRLGEQSCFWKDIGKSLQSQFQWNNIFC